MQAYRVYPEISPFSVYPDGERFQVFLPYLCIIADDEESANRAAWAITGGQSIDRTEMDDITPVTVPVIRIPDEGVKRNLLAQRYRESGDYSVTLGSYVRCLEVADPLFYHWLFNEDFACDFDGCITEAHRTAYKRFLTTL